MQYVNNTELSSAEETRCQFNGSKADIKLGIDVHQHFYTVVMQVGGCNPKPAQRFAKEAFLHWAAKLKQSCGGQVHAVYEACGFGFGLQRELSALGIECEVVCPQKLDEQNRRVKTDGLDAKALCLKLDRFVQGNRSAVALVRVPSEEEEQLRAIHRQREQLVKTRKQLEAQGRSLMVNHGIEPVQQWWKRRAFAALNVPKWMKELLKNSQPILLALEEKIHALTVQLQAAAQDRQPRGFGALTSVVIDREIANCTASAIGDRSAVTPVYVRANTVVATPACKVASLNTATRVCAPRWWKQPGVWFASSQTIERLRNGDTCWQKEPWPRELHARKPS